MKNLLITAFAIFGFATISLAQIGFVCNNNGNVYKTTNGGSSWSFTEYAAGSLTEISLSSLSEATYILKINEKLNQ